MSAGRIGRVLVRGLARAASWLYPARFRRAHAQDFADVAEHLFEREAARGPIGAAWSASQLIVADSIAASPALWRAALAEDGPQTMGTRVKEGLRGGWDDLRLAFRAARRRPGFAALVVLTLALGVGASTAAFDALDRAVVRPFPFRRNTELTFLVMKETQKQYVTSVSIGALNAWRDRASTVQGVEMFRRSSATLATGAGTEAREAISMSGALPALLGVQAVAGRTFTPADAQPSAPAVVMLGEGFWRAHFGADASVVGRSLTVGGKPAQVIGIWPAGARLDYFETPDIFRVLPHRSEYGSGSWVQVIARSRPGRSTREVVDELSALAAPFPAGPGAFAVNAIPAGELLLGADYVTGVWLAFAAGVVLLVAAIANASHLLLERAAARAAELGVRLALGASRRRLFRLFAAEGVVYGVLALAIGAAIALGLERAIGQVEPRLYREAAGAGLVGRAFWFAAGTALLAALACSVAPLARSGRRDLAGALAHGHARVVGGRSWVTRVLVSAQAAFAVLLVFGALLMAQSFRNLLTVDAGIELPRLAELSVSLPAARYQSAADTSRYLDQARAGLEAIPGVTGVVRANSPMMSTSMIAGVPWLEGEAAPAAAPDAVTAVGNVSASYFSTLGIRLIRGRAFTEDETNVAVVNEQFARAHGGDVVGRMLVLPGRPSDPHYQIVGVMNDIRYMGLANDRVRLAGVLFPEHRSTGAAAPDRFARFIVRTDGDPAAVIADARRVLAAIDPQVPLLAPATGPETFLKQTAEHRFIALLLAGMAGVGFALAMGGVYGAVSLTVARRRREMGLRIALGATVLRLVRVLVGEGLRPVLVGALAGFVAVWFAAPRIDALLFRVRPHDPLSGATGFGLVLLAAAAAALWPALRVGRIDPSAALRDS